MTKPVENISTKWKKIKSHLDNFWQKSLPIRWSKFLDLKLLAKSFFQAPNLFKGILVSSLVLMTVSFSFFSLGIYSSLTEDVPDQGGTFYESIVDARISKFNPVLNSNEAEKKIIGLIYHPLYHINYPNFLEDADQDPIITPVLIESIPTWEADPNNPSNQFHSLRMNLRKDIFWSNGEPITIDDIIYSFERLKETGGNSDFRNIFTNYVIERIPESKTEFLIRPANSGVGPNPQLIYSANFRPISKSFYADQNNDQLFSDLRSTKVEVTSGYFNIPAKVESTTNNRTEFDNPVADLTTGAYSQIVLKPNQKQNLGQQIYIERYVFNVRQGLTETADSTNTLETASRQGNLDLYDRFLGPQTQVNSQELQNLLGLEQVIRPTNTFFNLYLNIQPSSGGFNGFLINQTLRKYIICNFLDFQFSQESLQYLNSIPKERRLLPIQLNTSFNLDCTNIETELTSLTNESGRQIYTIELNEQSGIKRVKVFGSEIRMNMLSLQDFQSYGQRVQERLRDIGLPVEAIWADSNSLETRINEKNYHVLFLPVTLVNRNLYPLYGLSGRNLSNIALNDRVNGRVIEDHLSNYSNSNFENQESKQALIQFFQEQYVSLNLFQAKMEINYSNRVKKLGFQLGDFLGFPYQIYSTLPEWYIETRKQFLFD